MVSFIKDTIQCSEKLTVPVLRLHDLNSMYRERMLIHGAGQDDVEYIRSSRLKDDILFNVPGLWESKSGIHILLILQDEMGRALFETCNSSTHDDGIVIAEAADIIRRHMFSNEVSFNGDLS